MGTSVNPHRFLRFIGGAVLLPVTACAIARTQAAEGQAGEAARTLADTSAQLAGRTGIAEMAALPRHAADPFLAVTARLESGEHRRLTGGTAEAGGGRAGTGSRALGVAILVAIIAVFVLWGAAAIMARTEKT